jgi:dCTP deaminase
MNRCYCTLGNLFWGAPLSTLSLPDDVMTYVIGRSILGRLGLIIATATHVAPGYKRTITLELTNVGTVPIELTPGIRVAQLVFHGLVAPVSRTCASHGR